MSNEKVRETDQTRQEMTIKCNKGRSATEMKSVSNLSEDIIYICPFSDDAAVYTVN